MGCLEADRDGPGISLQKLGEEKTWKKEKNMQRR